MSRIKLHQTKSSLVKRIEKIFRDLEKVFKAACLEKSYTAALRAKELQLKEIFHSSTAQPVSKLKKLTSLQEFLDHFSDLNEDELTQLNGEIMASKL